MIPVWMYVVSMTVYVVLLILLTAASARWLLFGLGLNLAGIILLFFSSNVDGWFRWAKDLSVLIPMLVVHAGRIRSKIEGKPQRAAWLTGPLVLGFLAGILALNIFEASLKDITLGNYSNGLCGLIMIACIPFTLKQSWRFDTKEHNILVADLTLTWCLLYTTWNACFVYAESPAYFAASCCILLVPELFNAYSAAKGKGNYWLHARIYTLMIHVSLRSYADIFTPFMDASTWHNSGVKEVWGVVNLILMAAYAIWWILKLKEQKSHIPVAA